MKLNIWPSKNELLKRGTKLNSKKIKMLGKPQKKLDARNGNKNASQRSELKLLKVLSLRSKGLLNATRMNSGKLTISMLRICVVVNKTG